MIQTNDFFFNHKGWLKPPTRIMPGFLERFWSQDSTWCAPGLLTQALHIAPGLQWKISEACWVEVLIIDSQKKIYAMCFFLFFPGFHLVRHDIYIYIYLWLSTLQLFFCIILARLQKGAWWLRSARRQHHSSVEIPTSQPVRSGRQVKRWRGKQELCKTVSFSVSKSPYGVSLSQWPNFKLFGITYWVGKIKFKLFFSGSIGWVRSGRIGFLLGEGDPPKKGGGKAPYFQRFLNMVFQGGEWFNLPTVLYATWSLKPFLTTWTLQDLTRRLFLGLFQSNHIFTWV